MAKIQLKDLKADVELDREAMASITGGRGSMPVYRPGTGILTSAISGRSAASTLFDNIRRSRKAR